MRKELFFIFLLYLFLIFQIPFFVGDEGYYSISITNAIENGIKPYLLFFNVPSFWKPPLMVNVYSIIAIPFIEIFNLDAIYAYRIGSLLFSIFNVILVYLISKEFVEDKKKVKWITIIVALNPVILIYGTKIFMETMAMTFIFLGIYGCIKYKNENKKIWLSLIPLSIVGASYTKSFTIGIMSILLCGLYFFLFNLKKMDKFIVMSVIGILICVGIAYYSGFPEMYYNLFKEDFFTSRMQSIFVENTFSTLSTMLYLVPLFLISWKTINVRDKKDLFMLIWFIPLIPIIIKTPFVWYSFYFILPIVYLALKGIQIKSIDMIMIIFLIGVGLFFTMENFKGHKENEIITYFEENINKKDCIYVTGAPEVVLYSYLYHENYNFNFILKGAFEYEEMDLVSYHYFEEEEINKIINSKEEKCIENEKELFLSTINVNNNYYRSCNENCKYPKYILISSHPKINIENCYIIKEFERDVLWKCGNTN